MSENVAYNSRTEITDDYEIIRYYTAVLLRGPYYKMELSIRPVWSHRLRKNVGAVETLSLLNLVGKFPSRV